MFGEGRIANFEDVLDLKLSPFLSSVYVFSPRVPTHSRVPSVVAHRVCRAYQFWRANAGAFRACFHMCGYSGHALRVAKWAFRLGGVRRWARRMADAGSVEEQGRIWDEHLRPVLLAPWIARLFLANPSVLLFCFLGSC